MKCDRKKLRAIEASLRFAVDELDQLLIDTIDYATAPGTTLFTPKRKRRPEDGAVPLLEINPEAGLPVAKREYLTKTLRLLADAIDGAPTPETTDGDTTGTQIRSADTKPGPLMTIKEVAGLLRIHAGSVSTLHTTGRMPRPIKKAGLGVRFRRSDIEDWIRFDCKSAKATAALQEAERKAERERRNRH